VKLDEEPWSGRELAARFFHVGRTATVSPGSSTPFPSELDPGEGSTTSAWAEVPAVSGLQKLEQPSPFVVFPSSHPSRLSRAPFAQLEGGTPPRLPALLRGVGGPAKKSAALSPVSSASWRTPSPPSDR
jgi:hypothetical protein